MRRGLRQIILFVIVVSCLLFVPALSRTYVGLGQTLRQSSGDAAKYSQAAVDALGPVTTTTLSNNPYSTDWTIDSPVWNLSNGVLDGSGLSGYLSPKIISTAVFSSDRTVELDFRTVVAGDQPWYTAWMLGKYADFNDKANLLLLANGILQLSVSFGGTINYYSASTTLRLADWHHAKVIFTGNTATVYINGTLYISATDPNLGALGDCPISLASWGNSESQFNNVTVTGNLAADERPVAHFSATPQPAAPGQQVFFDSSSSSDPDGYITSYAWTFGDGATGSGPYPEHTYNVPGNYTVTLNVTDTSNLSATASQVVEIVTPILTLAPSSGSVGTKVLVQGSHFPSSLYGPSTTVEVTFDDQSIGSTTMTNSGFSFVFNVPVAQAGLHQIHAYEELYPAPVAATANFTVTPAQATPVLALTTSVGSIYFPGDTVRVFLLSSLNGNPSSVQMISLTLVFSNGTARSLTLSSPRPGLYTASYSVPATNSIGTYALVATAHLNGLDASSIASFEVKPTWLQSNARTLTTATSIAGAVGTISVLGVAWRKGYLTKKKDEPSIL